MKSIRTTNKLHPSITGDRILQAATDSMNGVSTPGFCIACGEDVEGVEPDARNYTCECCGKPAVFGAEELLLMNVA